MKRLIRLAARLYPKQWHQRYGVEFLALLDDVKPNLRATLDVAKGALKMQMSSWSSGRIAAVSGMLGALLAFGVSLAVPIKYESQAVVNVTSVAAPPMFRAEIDQQVADRMNAMSQRILGDPVLTTIIDNFGLYPAERGRMPMENMIALMRRNERVASPISGRLEGFVIRFSYEDRYNAQRVVDDLVSHYITENIRARAAGREKWPTTLQVLDPATLPSNPVSLRPSRITAIGLMLGLLIGAVCTYVGRKRQSVSTGILEKNPGGAPVFRGTGVPFQALV